MSVQGTPTLLQTRSFQALISDIRSRTLDVQEEATTGKIADLAQALRGDVGRVQKLEKSIAENERFLQTIASVQTRYQVMQSSLTTLSDLSSTLGIEITGSLGLEDDTSLRQQTIAAGSDFSNVVAALNSSVAGRYLFSGGAVTTAPLPDGEDILTDIAAIIAAAPDTASAQTGIDEYFQAGGPPLPATVGYETTIYQGDLTVTAPTAEVSPGKRVDPGVTALNDEVKNVLKHMAVLAVGLDNAQTEEISDDLLATAASGLTDAGNEVRELQAALGATEEEIEAIKARNEAETFSLELALSGLTTRDQFDAAAELNSLTVQLEAVFATTARIANLTLTNYLR